MVPTIGICLVNARFTQLSAEVGSHVDVKGGRLDVNIQNKVKEGADASSILGEIIINVTGFPKTPTGEKEFVFKLIVKVAGMFKRDDCAEALNIKNESFRIALTQPLYTMGVVEVRALGQKLGFSNIDLPWDMKTLIDMSEQKEAKASQMAPKAKRVAKASTKKLRIPKS